MKSKVIFITGGNSGMGLATAQLFASNGAHISILSRRAEKNQQAKEEILNKGVDCLTFEGDVSSEADVAHALQQTFNHFGALHYAFNNAGIEQSGTEYITDQTEEDYYTITDTNLKGVWLCLKHQIPYILKSGGGAIVNNASMASVVACPTSDIYAAAKHGVIGLTLSTALTYAKNNIRINAISPAGVKTPMIDRITNFDQQQEEKFCSRHPMGRCAEVSEIAEAVYWLCSDKSSFITGHNLLLDGGSKMKR